MYSVSTNRALLWQAERTTYTPTGWRSSPRIASTSALRYTVAYWCTVSYRNPDILAGTHRCHYRRLLAHDLAGEVQVRDDQINRLIFDLCTLFRSIVMLCNIVECGKKKCEQYWPESAGQEVPYPGLIQYAYRILTDHIRCTTSEGNGQVRIREAHDCDYSHDERWICKFTVTLVTVV